MQEGAGIYQTTIRGNRRCSAAVGYLKPVLGRKNLTVITGALVLRVIFQGTRATGVEYALKGAVQRGASVLTSHRAPCTLNKLPWNGSPHWWFVMVCACSLRTQQCVDECQCQFLVYSITFCGGYLLIVSFFRLGWSAQTASLSLFC